MKEDRTSVRGRTTVIGANGAATRAGMRVALAAAGVRVSAEVESVQELMLAVSERSPEVCLIDVDLSGNGLAATAELAVRAPSVSVVLLTAAPSEEQFLSAIRAGAFGYVDINVAPAALGNIVGAVLRGEAAIPRALVPILVDRYRARPTRRHLAVSNRRGVDLTSREWEVLDSMREGLSTRAIAERLVISDVTVRRHIGSVLKKLQVTSRNDALRLLETA